MGEFFHIPARPPIKGGRAWHILSYGVRCLLWVELEFPGGEEKFTLFLPPSSTNWETMSSGEHIPALPFEWWDDLTDYIYREAKEAGWVK